MRRSGRAGTGNVPSGTEVDRKVSRGFGIENVVVPHRDHRVAKSVSLVERRRRERTVSLDDPVRDSEMRIHETLPSEAKSPEAGTARR